MTDYEEIQNLVARYADAVTRRDFEALAAIFTPDAVWDVTGGTQLRFEGAELVPGIRGVVEKSSFLAHRRPSSRSMETARVRA
jgi:ketosteroid isomerase-like protein